jgi:DNA adenine methylase
MPRSNSDYANTMLNTSHQFLMASIATPSTVLDCAGGRTMETNTARGSARPIIKWAGGKGQLLEQFRRYYPTELTSGQIDTYVEPFLGGAAVFIELAQHFHFKKAYLFDINEELVLLYRVIQKAPSRLIEALGELAESYFACEPSDRENYFYSIRDTFNDSHASIMANLDNPRGDYAILRASQLVFLNRTCFNGLFRVNSKGRFNVPFGRYSSPTIVNEENIKNVSALLQNAEIERRPFDDVSSVVNSERTFVYFDPPYRPLTQTAMFTAYSRYSFNDADQTRLAHMFRKLDANTGARLMLSNSDPKNINPDDDFFETLFSGFHISRVMAKRNINSKSTSRGAITELLVTNYAV